jgi:NAD(P)H-dependent flavin oxidoreductase YrpB (nitropropane dioxygenase family)
MDLIGCRLPIQLAPLGGPVGSAALAAAVSQTGGLGMIANPGSSAEVERRIESARTLTTAPIGVGFLVPFVALEAVEAAAAAAEVVEFFYGHPDPGLVRVAHAHGARVAWQVGSAGEAVAAVEAGCDFVVAQGIEAGGHIRGRQRLDDVLDETLAAVDVPVLGAGGVGTADRFAEVLAAGAAGVAVGTRFVAAEESDAHPRYVERLIAASREDTVLTECFAADWPNAPHRVLRSAVDAVMQLDRPVAGCFRDQELPRLAARPPTRQTTGEIGAMALYAGESVDAVKRTQPAREIVAELTANHSSTTP